MTAEQRPANPLVERLRDVPPYEVTPVVEMWNLIEEAADEIERLRAENERLRADAARAALETKSC